MNALGNIVIKGINMYVSDLLEEFVMALYFVIYSSCIYMYHQFIL